MAFKHRLPLNYYSREFVGNIPDEDWEKRMRQEYSYMRSLAQKRIATIGKSEFSNTAAYENVVGSFPKLKDIASATDFELAFIDLYKFLTGSRSTVTELRKKRERDISAYQSAGYDWVTVDNYNKFNKYIEMAAEAKLFQLYSSDSVMEVIRIAMDKNISVAAVKKDFDLMLENLDKLEDIPRASNSKPIGSKRLRGMLNR